MEHLNSKISTQDDRQDRVESQTYFEAQLAEQVVNFEQDQTAAGDVSEKLLIVFNDHKELIEQIASSDKTHMQLQSIYKESILGHLSPRKKTVSEILYDISTALENRKSKVETVLPIHAIVAYNIIQQLKAPNAQNELYSERFKQAYTQNYTNGLKEIRFAEDMRTEKPGPIKPTQLAGTIKPGSKYAKKMTRPSHSRGMDKFSITLSEKTRDRIVKIFERDDVPIAAGPSTHGCSTLSAAYALGLEQSELQEYTGLVASSLNHNGHHSYHELFRVAGFAPLNIPYEPNNYGKYMPDSLKHTEAHKTLQKKYPHLL